MSSNRTTPLVTPGNVLISFAAMLALMGPCPSRGIRPAGADPSQARPRLQCLAGDDQARWRFIITAVSFAALSQIGPALLLVRLIRRLDRPRMEVIKAREEAEGLARFDPQTGLPSRRMLREHMRKRLGIASEGAAMPCFSWRWNASRRSRTCTAFQMGEKLILEISNRLKRVMPADAIASRVSGEEFAIFLPRPKTLDALGKLAQQIISQLSMPFQVETLEAGSATASALP